MGEICTRAVDRFENIGGGAISNVVGIICPSLVGIGLTELPNSGWAKAHPAHPLVAALQRSQYIRPEVTVHKGAETIQGR